MAANEQGKFWEMHDKIFDNQQKINAQNPGPDLERLAQEVGLNMSRYRAAMDGHKFKAQIEDDSKYGNSVGANGTPTFFINGREVAGAMPFEQFKSIIDEEQKKADELLKKGVKLDQVYEKLLEAAAQPSAAPQPAAAAGEPERKSIDAGKSPSKGPANAAVTIIEFSEFQ